jgi:hypothetical protein
MAHSTSTKRSNAPRRVPNDEQRHAMRDLIAALPGLTVGKDGSVDFPASDAAHLVRIADNAEITLGVINLGVSAIGTILAYASPEVEDRTISSETVEALAWLLSELGALGAGCFSLAAHCRRETSDYQPP